MTSRAFHPVTLSAAMADPELFGRVFAVPSFWTWKTIAKLIDGIELTEPREVELFEACTGLRYATTWAGRKVRRWIILAGRRAGKDRFESAVAVWRCALAADWRRHQSAGEGAMALLLGRDKRQAAILRKYCEGLLQPPMLARTVKRSTGELTEFKNGSALEITTNDSRLIRGRSAIGLFGSEACHWPTDELGTNSDEEVVAAGEPSMAMCPDGGLLMMGSSVHRRIGFMYRKFKELHGNASADSDMLVWFAPSAVMNPKLPQAVIDRALAENPAKARAEFLNVWRDDLSTFVPLDVIDRCTQFDVFERPPQPGVQYLAAVDGATGTGGDSYALCIGHRVQEGGATVIEIDLIRERKPPFVPSQIISELAQLCKSYRVYEVHADRHAFGYHLDMWRQQGIVLKQHENTTSENYLAALPTLLAPRVRLVNSTTLRSQLSALERTTGAGDRETVDHPRHHGAHDDVAAAVCGLISLAASQIQQTPVITETMLAQMRMSGFARSNGLTPFQSRGYRVDDGLCVKRRW